MTRFTVNGVERAVDDAARPLLDVLRDDLRLTGAKYGCGEGRCGACTVLVDGAPTFACTTVVGDVDGSVVTTVEQLAAAGQLHPVQAAFVDERALQCGYCTPGMVMRAVALLDRDPHPDDDTITDWFAGNICRCGGYPRICAAVHRAAAGSAAAPAAELRSAVDEKAVGPGEQTWTATVRLTGDAASRGWGWTTPGGVRVTVDESGRVHGYVGKVDGGQGNRWSLIRAIAGELAVGTGAVELTMGDTAASPLDLGTFGSRSTPDAAPGLRLAAAALRRALCHEAATRWEVPVERVVAAAGRVSDTASGRSISYGELVRASSRDIAVDPDEEIPSRPAEPPQDVDAVRSGLTAAVTGAKRFPSDIAAHGMLHGRVLRPPARGARLLRRDTSAARAIATAIVVEEDEFIGVTAPSREVADAALRAIDAEWSDVGGPSDGDIEGYLREHPLDQGGGWGGPVDHRTGDVAAAVAAAAATVEGTYTAAYIAHVPLEPRVALAVPEAGGMTVWCGTQRPFGVRGEVAGALGVDEEQVRVVVPDFGGGFGGKHTGDVAIEAARLARATGSPVRVAWTREEEFRHGYLRPAAVIDVRAAMDPDGRLSSWEFTNINSGAAGLMTPYDVPNQQVRFQPADAPLAQGSYRALAATANNFARESHIDEVAHVLGVDAVELRMRHLPDERLRGVLSATADAIGWSQPVESGAGIGIACGIEKGARVATGAVVAVDATGDWRVTRLVTAVDCGAVVDPDGLKLQITGATVMGLGGALFEAIRFERGRILNAGLADYRVPRFADVPDIEVILLDRPDLPSAGAGETPIIAVAPAIANAVRAATGRRLRSLPLNEGLST